jgi:serine/threonine-protein kinase
MSAVVDVALDRIRGVLGDRYRLDGDSAPGGMATVYFGEELKKRRPVAIKVLRPEQASEVTVGRFHREIAILGRLTHPHIVPLLDSDEREGLFYFIMPRLDGGTLRDRLERKGQLPIKDAVQIGVDVAEALSFAHAQGIIHRDVKPENILFSAGKALVADFGVARILLGTDTGTTTSRGVTIGTPAYMSPEQASGSTALDARSDIYSLACVVYEMLAGSPVFSGDTPQSVMARHLHEPPPSIRAVRREVSLALERVVLKALAKSPADRYESAAEFGAALRAPEPAAAADAGESVAVLAFETGSTDRAADVLGEGIPDEIINALARVPGLRVIGRTSSFRFKGTGASAAEIGAALHVRTVLEGSVSESPQRIHVAARLVNVADEQTLWAETYDRAPGDVIAIQVDIAKAIAARLLVGLDGGAMRVPEAPHSANYDAYHLYLRGRYHWVRRELKDAHACFRQALDLDPEYALAHAGLADACTLLAQYGLAPPAEVLPIARAAVKRALKLAPDLAEAHCAAGTIALVFDWKWRTAERELRRSIELNPRYDTARYWLALYLSYVRARFDEAVDQAKRAVALDPLAPLPAAQLGLTLIGAARYDEALTVLHRAIELGPQLFLPRTFYGVVAFHLGRIDDAIESLEEAANKSARHPWPLASLAVCFAAQGRQDKVEYIHRELVARAGLGYVQSGMLGVVQAALGDMTGAFKLLRRACKERDGILIYSKRYLAFATLQNDTRMKPIYRRIGIRA